MDDLSTLTPNDVSLDEGYGSILVVDSNQNDTTESECDLDLEESRDDVQISGERMPSLSDSVDSTLDSSEQTDDQTDAPTDDHNARELPDLAVLAQENPAIAAAAQELLQLLEEELQDSEEADLSLLQSLCS